MNKLGRWLEHWWEGRSIRGIKPTLCELETLVYIYEELKDGRNPEFIQSGVKRILNICGIRTEEKGIGWVAYKW